MRVMVGMGDLCFLLGRQYTTGLPKPRQLKHGATQQMAIWHVHGRQSEDAAISSEHPTGEAPQAASQRFHSFSPGLACSELCGLSGSQ